MKFLAPERLHSYRALTFRLSRGNRVRSKEEAIDFVNQRGFVYFWPIQGVIMPSLWAAVAGDRPVADEHDDPGHVTWGWKDSLLGKRLWYYAKILRKRATIISLDIARYFYALSDNYGSPEEDYLTLYEQGRITQEVKTVYEALLREGPLDTIALRKATRMTSRESDHRFNRALTELQAGFMVMPVGVTQAGRWRYAFAYDVVARHMPELPEQAHYISESEARRVLVEHYLRSVGAVQVNDLVKLFGWGIGPTQRIVDELAETDFLHCHVKMPNIPGEWLAVSELS